MNKWKRDKNKKKEYDRLRYLSKREEILSHVKENYRKDPLKKRIYDIKRRPIKNKNRNTKYKEDEAYREKLLKKQKTPHATKVRKKDEDFALLLISQNISCASCKTLFIQGRFCIDHDHFTNKIRGILCVKCNSGIGL